MRRKGKLHALFSGMMAGVIGITTFVPSTPLWAAPQERMTTKPIAGEISVSPELRYQTLKGWGTSLCWWGNTIGSWGDADYNGNGKPDREEIAELAFSPEYLNLNIVRYNVGGGDKEDTSIKRCEGLVPGWTEDMTGTKDGTGAYDEAAFLAKPSEEMADAGQIWMLEQANKWRKEKAEKDGTENDIINEVFSNSPPYYMTKSGSSTGGYDSDWYNLKDDCYDDFAVYMARAAKWLERDLHETYGTGVDYIEPLNEPDTDYWKNGSTKQEGCIFSPGERQSKAYREMRKVLDDAGLDGIQITGTDETALSNAIYSFNHLEDDVKQDMTTIGAHTYSGNDEERKELRRIAQSYDKDLWMSEVTKGGGSHSEARHNSMEAVNAQSQSEGIMADLKYMQPTAWIAWLLADSEYECIQTDSNWGLLHAVFEKDGQPVPDYHTNLVNGDGSRKDGVPGEGYWAVTKQFYTMMQYSKFLKAGYTMIDVKDGNICAAVAPDGSELVVVAQNFGNRRTTTLDLGKFTNLDVAEVYRTSDSESCEKVDEQTISSSVLEMALPGNSVTTYVIKAEDGKTVCDMGSYTKTVDADVVKGAEWASDTDKFEYSTGWGESGSCDGKYTEENGASVTFQFHGERALIYGTKENSGATVSVSVDGGDAKEVPLYASSKNTESLLFDTGKLSDGDHTVTMTNQVDGGKKLLEVNFARIVSGNYSEAEVLPCESVFTVNGIAPVLPETVDVKIGEETVKRPVAWNVEGADFTGSGKTVKLEGNVSGTSKRAYIDVHVTMENVVYFIDCNKPDSPEYQKYADPVNESADQKYAEGSNMWGYLGEYLPHDQASGDYDVYETGWYVDKSKDITAPIEYRIPLSKGTYDVTFASKEWWRDYNSSRPMDVFMQEADGDQQKIGTTNTFRGNDWWNADTFEIALAQDGDVVFSVKPTDGGQEAVLSYLRIQKKLNLDALKGAIMRAQNTDESKYANNPEGVAALKQAVAEGHRLLYASSATQEAVDAAAVAIGEALENLGKIEVVLDEPTLRKNDYVLYTVNCGTPDAYKIPNPESERLGLLQSCVDQALGEDEMTGYTWGRDADTRYSVAASEAKNAFDIGESFIYMASSAEFDAKESALGYTFDVPTIEADGIEPDMYEVTVAFKQYWTKKWSNILLEGRTVATDVGYDNGEWVCKTFTTKVTDGKLNVQVKSPRRTNADGDPVLNYIKVRAVKHTEPQIVTYDSISGVAGASIYDTNGNLIQAHGGQIQKLTVDGVEKWYWIGEDKTNDYRPCGGIHVYSSTDLYNWDDEGVVLKTMESVEEFETDDYFKNLYGSLGEEEKEEIFIDLDRNNCVIERPKMLYNDKTKKYVIWFHADGRTPTNDADYGKAKAGIAVGDSPAGPFRLLGTYKLSYHKGEDGGADPNYDYGYDEWEGRGSVRDMNLFKDDDGTAYVIYSSDGNNTTYISKLNEDYTGLAVNRDEAVEGTDFVRAFGYSREAPAMFKYQGKYYIINSGLTGWSPNPAEYWVADHPFGPWMPKGNPCTDWEADTTYRTQSTCVIPVDPEKGQYIYMGDRWFADNLSDSRYVWLPIEFGEDESIALKRYENWKMEEVWGAPQEADVTELQKAIDRAEAIKGAQADYTNVSWTAYQSALQKARDLVKNPGNMQSVVNAAADALTKAVEELKTLASVLDDALKEYAKPEGVEKDYTKESWDVYQGARETVQNLRASEGYTEADVTRAVEALSKAFAGLEKAGQEPEEPGKKVLVNQITVTGATELAKGESAVLKAEVSPSNATNKNVDWSTSDEKVATVTASGVVTGQGKGIVTVTATAVDGSGVKGSCQITVTDAGETPAPVKDRVTKITLKSGSKGVAAGKKVTIKATVKTTGSTADKTLKWTSSNKKYATVNARGVVTTKKAGAGKTVTITAKATDGSNKSAKIKVKILKHAVKKITLSCSQKSVKAGQKVRLKAKISTTGKTANKTLEWSVSNKKYATVNSKGVVSTKKAGAKKRVTITAKATDGTEKKASIKLKINP